MSVYKLIYKNFHEVYFDKIILQNIDLHFFNLFFYDFLLAINLESA